ncbi:MAG: MFS transporter [Microbacterium sp. SCN 70-200]|uniref:MFS transporter n=1 Tax=unclassified Microbacterium TaxID=2609290 RepID=UPI00086B74AE|nr:MULTISPECIES: MFS transporter [unclassified Microbacterium]ODT42992.1 MAG: MFS transporter [Microbacterium sp. SCN 70-200]OJV84703.1 MAG: MFS transporter [Microbacterium sp. 70-16]
MTDMSHPDTPSPDVAFGATAAQPIPRKRVVSWAMWDWAMQPFNTVILTFVWVALYLTSREFLDPAVRESGLLADGTYMSCNERANLATAYCQGLTDLSEWWGWANFVAGILILLLAPVLGQQADARGSKKKWIIGATLAIALIQFSLFFVEADPKFFWFGALAVATGAVVSEIGNVSYYAMLSEVSTPKTVGRVSGLGWGLGYIGGVVALIVCIPVLFGLGQSNPLAYKLVAVICGVWTLVFSIPLFRNVPESPAYGGAGKTGFFASYVVLAKNLKKLFVSNRPTFWFLVASAVYRDGLAGVFAFGAVLAAQGFGFSFIEVILFGLAANLVAGISTIFAGRLDDAIGPRRLILIALTGLVAMAFVVFVLRDFGTIVFWICGLALCAFVGPAQAASRGLLTRLTPPSMQGEIFGLYATTGRVASFLSPLAWSLSLAWFGGIVYGVLGIGVVLLLGLVLLLLVKLPPHVRA